MKAKIAYLTSPAPNVFVINLQVEGEQGIEQFEISKAHLTNIIIDGASLAFREQYPHRVHTSHQEENADDRAGIYARRASNT